jgi:hypothetical protein
MGKSEQRFRSKEGVQYIKSSGRVRCQAVSNSRARKWREEFDDYDTHTADLWPECQCPNPAVDGMFVCKYHGGMTPKKKNAPRSLLDVMPVDLAEKFSVLYNNPDYISRKDDILLLQARQWTLIERLEQETGSQEAWDDIHEALVCLNRGDEPSAKFLIEKALESKKAEDKIWDEVRKNSSIIKDLTNTQVRSAKELQAMATAEQVNSLIANIITVIIAGANKYIDDDRHRSTFLSTVSTEVQRFTNTGVAAVVGHLTEGSGTQR